MKAGKFRAIPLLLVFLLQVFISSPSLSSLNLCIGQDGHMEIESKESDCCPSRPGNESAASLTVEQSGCESCLDVPLGDAYSSTTIRIHGMAQQGLHPARTVQEILAPFLPARFAFLNRGNPIEPTLEAIRSTVLRV